MHKQQATSFGVVDDNIYLDHVDDNIMSMQQSRAGNFEQGSSSVGVSQVSQFGLFDADAPSHRFQGSQFQDETSKHYASKLRKSDLKKLQLAVTSDVDSTWAGVPTNSFFFSDSWSPCNLRTGMLNTVPLWEIRADTTGFQDAQKSTSNSTVRRTLGKRSSTSRSRISQHDNSVLNESANNGSVHDEPQNIPSVSSVPPSVQSGSHSAQSVPRAIEAFGESQADDAFTSTLPTSQGNPGHKPEQPSEKPTEHDFPDSETVYSLDSAPGEEGYVIAFAHRLLCDLKNKKGLEDPSTLPPAFITQTLRIFARRLYEESTNPFQWGTSAVLHKKRK